MVETSITDNWAAMPGPVIKRAVRMLDAYVNDRLASYARELITDKAELRMQFNMDSCMAFLVDEDMQCYVSRHNELCAFVTCPECGNEGDEKEFSPKEGCASCAGLVRICAPTITKA